MKTTERIKHIAELASRCGRNEGVGQGFALLSITHLTPPAPACFALLQHPNWCLHPILYPEHRLPPQRRLGMGVS